MVDELVEGVDHVVVGDDGSVHIPHGSSDSSIGLCLGVRSTTATKILQDIVHSLSPTLEETVRRGGNDGNQAQQDQRKTKNISRRKGGAAVAHFE